MNMEYEHNNIEWIDNILKSFIVDNKKYKNNKKRLPFSAMVNTKTDHPPPFIDGLSWYHLKQWERDWFNCMFPNITSIINIKRYAWEIDLLFKLHTQREVETFLMQRRQDEDCLKEYNNQMQDLSESFDILYKDNENEENPIFMERVD